MVAACLGPLQQRAVAPEAREGRRERIAGAPDRLGVRSDDAPTIRNRIGIRAKDAAGRNRGHRPPPPQTGCGAGFHDAKSYLSPLVNRCGPAVEVLAWHCERSPPG